MKKSNILFRTETFWALNELVENCSSHFLTQISSTLFIPVVYSRRQQSDRVNSTVTNQRVKALLWEFANIVCISSSGYNKFSPKHGVKHVIDTGYGRPVRYRARPLFGK